MKCDTNYMIACNKQVPIGLVFIPHWALDWVTFKTFSVKSSTKKANFESWSKFLKWKDVNASSKLKKKKRKGQS